MPRKRIGKAANSAQVDGDKKGMGGYVSKMRMDDMPIDWIEQVISFLPITDVFKCRSVCRTWYVAANNVLSDWETLMIVMKDGKTQPVRTDKNEIFLTKDKVWFNRSLDHGQGTSGQRTANAPHAQTWIERLKQLARLKEMRFFMLGFDDWTLALVAVVDDVVLRNQSTLTILNVVLQRQSWEPNHPVWWDWDRPELEHYLLDPDWAAACPRLVKLRTSISVITLQKLPAETLTCLHIDYLIWLTGSHEEIGQLFAALSRFTRLKSLILAVGCKTFRGQWTELHDRPFSNLFTNMIELEEVEITFPLDNAVDMDAVIETLVHNCPSVSSITMNYARTTNVILHSLSRLTQLHHLVFRSYMGQSKITTEGILSLLRGGSRNVLRDLELHTSVPPDLGQIRAEGQLMRQETGRSLSVNRDRSSYDDHQLVKVCVAGD